MLDWQQRMDAALVAFRSANPLRRATVAVGEMTLDVLVAETPAQWSRGLIDQPLDGADGMLFVMPPGSTNAFHMRGMQAMLVVLFFDEQGQAVDLGVLEPDSGLKQPVPFTYALELTTATLGRHPGLVSEAVVKGLRV